MRAQAAPLGIDPVFLAVLKTIAEAMRGEPDDWCVIGGAAAVLHGVEFGKPNDVDLLTSAGAATRVLERLGVAVASDGGNQRFCSQVFCRWSGHPIQIEIFGGFEVKTPEGWKRVIPSASVCLDLGVGMVYLPTLEELAQMHRLFGRHKDLERASRLLSGAQ